MGSSFNKAEAKHWGKAFDRYLRGWLPSQKDSAIIDAGCGWGRLLYFFKERKYLNIQGVDISPEQVQLAKEICDNVLKGDAIEHLANHPQSFDFIIGLDIIEHFKKDEVFRFLEVCYKALRSGGRLVLQTPNAESPFMGKVRYGDITHELAFDPQGLRKLILIYGFNKVEYRQTGPVVHGLLSLARFLLWKIIWICLALWSLAEIGSIGSGIYTRVFLISAVKE